MKAEVIAGQKYWKNDANIDVFFYVHSVKSDTGRVATINGCWMAQGTKQFWFVSRVFTLKINKKEYSKWKPYEPYGTLRL